MGRRFRCMGEIRNRETRSKVTRKQGDEETSEVGKDVVGFFGLTFLSWGVNRLITKCL